MKALSAQLKALLHSYAQILAEAFSDINDFLDEKLESDLISYAIIGLIVLTPIIGAIWFILALSLSA